MKNSLDVLASNYWILIILLFLGVAPCQSVANDEEKVETKGAEVKNDSAAKKRNLKQQEKPEFILTVRPAQEADQTSTSTCVAAVEMLYAKLTDQNVQQVILWWMTPEGKRVQFVLDGVEENIWARKIDPGSEPGAHSIQLIVLLEEDMNHLKTVCSQTYELDMPEVILTRTDERSIAPEEPSAPTLVEQTQTSASFTKAADLVNGGAQEVVEHANANPWPLLILILFVLNVTFGLCLGVMHALAKRLGWKVPFFGQKPKGGQETSAAEDGEKIRKLMEQAGIMESGAGKPIGHGATNGKDLLGTTGDHTVYEKTVVIEGDAGVDDVSTEEIVKSLGITLDQIQKEQSEKEEMPSEPAEKIEEVTEVEAMDMGQEVEAAPAEKAEEEHPDVNPAAGEEDLVKKLDLNDLSF